MVMQMGKDPIKQNINFLSQRGLSIGNSRVKAPGEQNMQMEAKLGEHQDITAAKGTYEGFISLFKWGTIASVVVTAIVVLIIA